MKSYCRSRLARGFRCARQNPHCVRGKGRSLDQRRTTCAGAAQEIHLDYCILGASGIDQSRTVIVAKDHASKAILGSVVASKGTADEFPAKRIRAFINEPGFEHFNVILKTDQEASIRALADEVARLRAPAVTVREEAPFAQSASNGVVDRGVLTLENEVRVVKDAVENRIGREVPGDHLLVSWLIRFSAVLADRPPRRARGWHGTSATADGASSYAFLIGSR